MTTTSDVAVLERLAARSWRGLEEEPFGDWLLRAGGGFTGRANSVLVLGNPPCPLRTAVPEVGRWYAARGLRPQAQVPLPGAEAADAAFAAAGWTTAEDVLVLTAPLLPVPVPAPEVPVDLAPAPDEAWLAGYRYRGTPLPPGARRILLGADDEGGVGPAGEAAPGAQQPVAEVALLGATPAACGQPLEVGDVQG